MSGFFLSLSRGFCSAGDSEHSALILTEVYLSFASCCVALDADETSITSQYLLLGKSGVFSVPVFCLFFLSFFFFSLSYSHLATERTHTLSAHCPEKPFFQVVTTKLFSVQMCTLCNETAGLTLISMREPATFIMLPLWT